MGGERRKASTRLIHPPLHPLEGHRHQSPLHFAATVPYLGILASLQLIDPSVANIALVKASDALQMHGAVLTLGASVSTLAQAAAVLVMGFFGDLFGH